MSYWDTSALVKLYVPEPDSPGFEQYAKGLVSPGTTARIASWEARATFRRKEAEGDIKTGSTLLVHAELLADIVSGRWRIVELSPDVEAEFARILDFCALQNPPMLVRTLDAIHLASARVAGETEIVVADKRMRQIAAALGLKLFPA